MNLIELLDRSAAAWPEKPAFVEGECQTTYAALAKRVDQLVGVLSELSLPPGGRVGIHFPNGVDYVALTFALWKLSIVVVPVPVECTGEETSEIIQSLQLVAVISPKSHGNSTLVEPGCYLTRFGRPADGSVAGINLAFIRFTSGTTSARKGVALTHETIRDRVRTANKALRITEADTVVWTLPMSHHFLVTIVLYVAHGATVVLARHVLAAPILEAVQRWRGTVLYASPFHYAMLAQDKSAATISSVRLAVSTTCPLSEEVALEFRRRFNLPLSQALGIIELGLVSLNDSDPLHRWNSVGQPLPDFEVQLLFPDETGAGELSIRGPGMFDAYAAPWVPRELAAPDGWFLTGDIARFDADGFLYLVSRKVAVINLAGRKVFPEEIEAVLDRHPAVRESRVYGRPHPHLGEVIEAELVLEGDPSALDSIRAHCRAHLSPCKIPSRLHIVSELPRTSVTGKIRREPVAAN